MKPTSIRHLAIVLWVLIGSASAHAQVVFDGTFGTLGPAPTGLFRGNTEYLIDQSAGRLVRSPTSGRANLFHSFSQFDIPSQQTATFRATESIDTIIARVTSQTPSFIDGRLRAQIPGADLFFVNPAGVFFSSTAQIELPASFHVSTADYLRFGDGITFSSTSTTPNVTFAPPEAFGFMAGPAAEVLIAQPLPLRMARGSTLSVVAGTVTIGTNGGTVLAPGGQVQLAGVGSAATEVPVDLRSWSTRGGTRANSVPSDSSATSHSPRRTQPIQRGTKEASSSEAGASRPIAPSLRREAMTTAKTAIDIEVAGDVSVIDSNLISRGLRPKASGFPARVSTSPRASSPEFRLLTSEPRKRARSQSTRIRSRSTTARSEALTVCSLASQKEMEKAATSRSQPAQSNSKTALRSRPRPSFPMETRTTRAISRSQRIRSESIPARKSGVKQTAPREAARSRWIRD